MNKRVRFEVFKRDKFTCRYCGKSSPAVVLEVDHVIPRSSGGSDDEMNLVTSCFDCNRGKSDRNLSEIITGEDPHDRAIELLERERQLAEYNTVARAIEKRINRDVKWLLKKRSYNAESYIPHIKRMLKENPLQTVHDALEIALSHRTTGGFIPYTFGILKNWKENASH